MADTEALVNQLSECAEKQDFEGAFKLVRENQGELAKSLQPTGVRDALKKTTKARLLLSFLEDTYSSYFHHLHRNCFLLFFLSCSLLSLYEVVSQSELSSLISLYISQKIYL